uniref:Uncharacterized protein n=1 Tax=viral metagenome TaxID=1070528 RepID=A0A6M3LRI9_9ZZZZ
MESTVAIPESLYNKLISVHKSLDAKEELDEGYCAWLVIGEIKDKVIIEQYYDIETTVAFHNYPSCLERTTVRYTTLLWFGY